MRARTTFRNITLLCVCLFLCLSSLSSKNNLNSTLEESNDNVVIEEQILYKEYIINPFSVTPISGRTNYLSPGYFIKIDRERANGNLPYSGRIMNIAISQDNSILFDDEIYDYRYHRSKRGDYWQISFKVPGKYGEVLHFTIMVYKNRSCNININSLHRNSIWYDGEFKRLSDGMNSLPEQN